MTEVAEGLHTTSDHQTLRSTISLQGSPQESAAKGRFRPETTDPEEFERSLKGVLPRVQEALFTGRPTLGQLDRLTEEVTNAIATALAASTKRAMGTGTGQPWWNQSCREAAAAHRRARADLGLNSETTDQAKKELRRVVRKAKRDFWRQKVNDVTEGSDIFQMVGWNRSIGQYDSPPLKDPETDAIYTRPDEKRNLLTRTLLQKAACQDDIPIAISDEHESARLLLPPATQHEIEDTLLRTKDTTPGPDEIPIAAIRRAWPQVREAVCTLFTWCLELGWHPAPFRAATLVAIPKPGKGRDKSNPRSYRLIALQSVLGKGLERLVARRLAWAAVREKITHPQYFGALPGRSAVDLAAAAVHDIEESWARGKVVTLLTLDVRGAFDAVLPGRLVQRLCQQGWPSNIVRWVASFVSQRSAAVRLDRETGAPVQIQSGLPQGSPASPILFMLFMQPLFTLGSRDRKRARFGYADDISLLAASDSLESNCETLQEDSREIVEWARLEGLTFDAKKSELVHFTRRRGDDNPNMRIRLGPEEEHTVQPTAKDKPLRWLGVLLDRKLTFKAHVTAMAAKAAGCAAGVRALGNTVRGAPPRLLRQAVQACVVPILCYGAEAWWPGLSRTRNGKTVSNRVDGLVHRLEVVQNNALRGILPVYRTTPIPALHREAAIRPIQITLDHKASLAAARMKRLDSRHPLVRRTTRPRAHNFDTRLLRTAARAGPTESHDPLVLPPWERRAKKDDAAIGHTPGCTREEAAAECAAWAATSSSRDLVVYTDGSQVVSPTRAAGAGWVICQGPGHPIISRGRHPLPQAEVFDAEAVAALKGLQEACGSVRAEFSDNLIICLDNLEVARSLMARTTSSSQGTFTTFAEVASRWSQRVRWLNFGPGRVIIRWVPGHAGIRGNEAADQEARAAAEDAARMPKEGPGTLAWTKRCAKENAVAAFQAYWEKNTPQRYKDLGIKPAAKPPELRLRRFALGKLLASRSGHGDFAAYHKRFAHTDAQTSCQCGREKTPEHFYFCRLGRRATRGHWGTLGIREVLSTPGGATRMDTWLAKTGYFSSICSPHPPSDGATNDTD